MRASPPGGEVMAMSSLFLALHPSAPRRAIRPHGGKLAAIQCSHAGPGLCIPPPHCPSFSPADPLRQKVEETEVPGMKCFA